MHGQLVAELNGFTDRIDIGEIDLRVNALRVQVQPQRHQVYVAGALTVTEQAPLNAVCPRQVPQFGCRHARAAVIVRVQGQHNVFTVLQVAVHPLDGVRVNVRGGHLNGGGQVHDQLFTVYAHT